jgi:hypothetical protein
MNATSEMRETSKMQVMSIEVKLRIHSRCLLRLQGSLSGSKLANWGGCCRANILNSGGVSYIGVIIGVVWSSTDWRRVVSWVNWVLLVAKLRVSRTARIMTSMVTRISWRRRTIIVSGVVSRVRVELSMSTVRAPVSLVMVRENIAR